MKASSFVDLLIRDLRQEIQDGKFGETEERKMSFLVEQLSLAQVPPKQRRYSPDLLAAATMWKTTSPALYKQLLLENVLSIPSIGHLSQLSKALTTETGMSNATVRYLKMRIGNIDNREKKIVLIGDEIHCAQRVEYIGGRLFGNEEGSACKTLFCFMIRAIAGSYNDVIALCPTNKLDAKKIKHEFKKVLQSVTEVGFHAVALSFDNATPNKRFYIHELCGGNLQTKVIHPFLSDKPLFLLFDAVHNFKNIFNNSNNRKQFIFPCFGDKAGEMQQVNKLMAIAVIMMFSLACTFFISVPKSIRNPTHKSD